MPRAENRKIHQTADITSAGGPLSSRNERSRLVGAGLIGVSLLFLVSDLLELAIGGLTGLQLLMRLFACLFVVPVVLALFAIQRPRIGAYGEAGSLMLAFSSFVLSFASCYALVSEATAFSELGDSVADFLAVGAIGAVLGTAFFCHAALRAGLLSKGAAAALIGGVALAFLGRLLPGPAWFAGALVWEAAALAIGVALALPGVPQVEALIGRLGAGRDHAERALSAGPPASSSARST